MAHIYPRLFVPHSIGLRTTCAALGFAMALAGVSSASAATIGRDQVVTIDTTPSIPSHCLFRNDAGTWTTYSSPEHVSITKAIGPTLIECTSENGHYHGRLEVSPGPSASSLVEAPIGVAYGASEVLNGFTKDGQVIGGFFTAYNNHIVVPLQKVWDEIPAPKPASADAILLAAPVSPTPLAALQPPAPPKPHVSHAHRRHAARARHAVPFCRPLATPPAAKVPGTDAGAAVLNKAPSGSQPA